MISDYNKWPKDTVSQFIKASSGTNLHIFRLRDINKPHNSDYEMHTNGNVVEVVAAKDKETDVVDNAEVIIKKSVK
ncbi:hypothetical protein Tco_1407473 [Tanacetum coccineum]